MRITPIEIKQKTFSTIFRGYEKQEVQAFLMSLATEWERIQSDNKTLKTKLDQTQQEINKLREVEKSLFKTLKTAEDTRTTLIEQASKTAELQVKEAEIHTGTLLTEAKNKAKDIVDKSETKALKVVEEAENEVRKMQKSYATIEQWREQLIGSLKILSQEILQKLQRIEKMPISTTEASFDEYLLQIKQSQYQTREQKKQVKEKIPPATPTPAPAPTPTPTPAPFHKKEAPTSFIKTNKQQAKTEHTQPAPISTSSTPSKSGGSFFDELE